MLLADPHRPLTGLDSRHSQSLPCVGEQSYTDIRDVKLYPMKPGRQPRALNEERFY